jgi:hypothetical protein
LQQTLLHTQPGNRRPTEAVKIKRHANQKTNTGKGMGSNVLNYRLKHSSTGLPMPTPAKK